MQLGLEVHDSITHVSEVLEIQGFLGPSFQQLRDPRMTVEAARPLEVWAQKGHSVASAHIPLEQVPGQPRLRGEETNIASQWNLHMGTELLFIVGHN